MRNNYYQQPYFQGNKSSTYINQMNPIISNIKQNPRQNIYSINLQSTPQIIPTNKTVKRFLSPPRINRIDNSYFGNDINHPKISRVGTFSSFNTPKPLGSHNYNSKSLTKNITRNHNLLPGLIQNQNIMSNIPINQSTIKPVNGVFANNPNQMNNIITNQNIINLTNGNNQKPNLITNAQINQSLTVNNINNPIINSNAIKNPIPSNNPIINSQVPNSNLINNIQVPNAITANNPASNTNIINITPTPTNFNPPMPGINNFGNGLNFAPRNDISLVAPKPLGQQPILMNNNFLSMNNTREPNETINLAEFRLIKEIGEGTFGKIYKVLWIINNKVYALKKEILRGIEGVKARQHRNEAIKNFIKQTNCNGVVSLYGNLTIPNGIEFQYYELMEMCDMDFEKEIKMRSVNFRFYSQQEMFNIMLQLITTLSFLQKCHITHRDIKPQNILISNGIYKLCDFGDIRVMQRDGVVIQRVRGSELYMSPILFNGLRSKALQVRHNTYKSDVFSLGMCFLLAACLSYDGLVEIRELSDMNQKDLILNKYLSSRYSPNMIKLLHFMLQTEEFNRPDFILLESLIRQFGI
jgi:hypothetical protein